MTDEFKPFVSQVTVPESDGELRSAIDIAVIPDDERDEPDPCAPHAYDPYGLDSDISALTGRAPEDFEPKNQSCVWQWPDDEEPEWR